MLGCKNDMGSEKSRYLTENIPDETPITFKENLIPKDKLIHKGIFSPDFKHYYYTISTKDFKQFDVYVIDKVKGSWSKPRKAFFNSTYDDHGMSFSPDGNTLYFSSTRPVNIEKVAETWHIWKSEKINGKWSKATYVDIPNLRNKLVSHPVLTNSGTLYFHSSNLDYSDMDIYHSNNINGVYGSAIKTSISTNIDFRKCTPYVSPKEDYLIFAEVGNQLSLMISFNDGSGKWTQTRRLNANINALGQGNPFITSDGKFLFYTVGDYQNKNRKIKWVNIKSEILAK